MAGTIGFEDILVSAVAGGVDVGLDYVAQAKTPIVLGLSIQDLYRIVAPVGSYIVNFMNYETEYSEIVFYSTVQSLERVIANKIKAPLTFKTFYPGTFGTSVTVPTAQTPASTAPRGKYTVTG
jgi:hypothetical protein